jgi:hypothetical protein
MLLACPRNPSSAHRHDLTHAHHSRHFFSVHTSPATLRTEKKRMACPHTLTSIGGIAKRPSKNMNDENTPLWIAPRSAIIVFRFYSLTFGEVSNKRHTLIRVRLRRLGCPPCTSLTPGCPVEKPAIFDTMTGISFQSSVRFLLYLDTISSSFSHSKTPIL